jgi:O-antigen/teichoic acid export membrane protein
MNEVDPNREYTRFSWQIALILAANIIALLLGLVRLPILTKDLGANLYGTWSLLDVTISLITPFALAGLHMGIVRFLSAEKDDTRIREDFISVFSVVFILGAVFSVLLVLFSNYLAELIFKDTSSAIYIKLASFIILLNATLTLSLAFFQAFRKIGLYTIIGLTQGFLQVGLMVLFISLGYELSGVITACVVSGVLFNLMALFIILKQYGFQLPRFIRLGKYLRFSIPLAPNIAIMWIINASDRYMISYFMGVTDAGIYSAAYSLGSYAAFLIMPIGTVIYPTIAKLYDEGNLDKTRNYLSYSVKYFFMVAIPAGVGISVLAKPLLQILTTAEFAPGAVIIPFVASGVIINAMHPIGEYIILLAKKTNLLVMLLILSAITNIILNIILIPGMGLLGAAVATLIAYALLGISTLLVSRRYLKFNLNPVFMLKSIAASTVMALCIRLIDPRSIAWVIASIAIGVVIYFGALLALKGLSRGEIKFFASLVTGSLNNIKAITAIKPNAKLQHRREKG